MRFIFTLVFGLFSITTFAQLVTSGGMSASQLVQDVLIGEGVEVSNVTFSGASQAIGTFNAANTSLGISEGIIMTTGTIQPVPDGPHGPNNKADAGLDNGVGGYSQLSNLVHAQTYNAAVLEFDFVPYSDTVSFRYVFASEEYPEYVGTEFNDVFAFFISGPGLPEGGKNMAIIPGTNQTVAINNVNHLPGKSTYYVNNGDGTQSPYNSNNYYIQYDGFTKPLIAYSPVECGETYHLIIAIADVSDPVWDSGIFLEKNSLNSNQPVKVDYALTNDPYNDGVTMAQNCTSAIVTITRSGNQINQALTIPINVSGTAIEGVDYSSIPSSVTFAPGQTTLSFTIDALNNVNLSMVVNLILEFEIEDACGNDEFQTIELFIKPVDPVEIKIEDQVALCPDEPIVLAPVVSGGGGEYTFIWSTGETTPTITVNPSVTTTYTVSVTDECLNQTATTTVTVTVPVYEPLTLTISNDIFEDCPFIPNVLYVEASGGSGIYYYQWTENGVYRGSADSLIVTPGTTTTYIVTVTDYCGEVATAQTTVHILSPPLELEITPSQEICPGDSVYLEVIATGGFGDYYYFWTHNGDTTNSVWVSPSEDTEYKVIVKDDCQTFQVVATTTVKVIHPIANFEIMTNPEFIGLPVTFQNLTVNGETYYWDFGNDATSTLVHPNNTYDEPGVYEVMLIATDSHGCKDTITKPIILLEEFYLYVPNTFTPDGNRHNNTFSISAIGIEKFQIRIYNRWGELLFEAKDVNFEWDGSYGGVLVEDGTYIWKMEYTTVNSDNESTTQVGHINVLR